MNIKAKNMRHDTLGAKFEGSTSEILKPEIEYKNKKDAPRCTDHFSY